MVYAVPNLNLGRALVDGQVKIEFHHQKILIIIRSPDPSSRTVGKTLSDAFVRFPRSHVNLVLHTHQARILKGRQVQLRLASPDELFRRMFPLREGNVYLTRGEIAALLMVCKNYKVQKDFNTHFLIES